MSVRFAQRMDLATGDLADHTGTPPAAAAQGRERGRGAGLIDEDPRRRIEPGHMLLPGGAGGVLLAGDQGLF